MLICSKIVTIMYLQNVATELIEYIENIQMFC